LSKIFISYRRADTAYISSYLYDELSRAFGKSNVFLDVDSIGGGIDYRQAIENALDQCAVLLVLIGPQWATIRDAKSDERRLDQPDDAVRLEVEGGLRRRGMIVLPLLTDNAHMPTAGEMPPGLAELSYRNAQNLRPGADLRPDLERVINTIARTIPRVGTQPVGMPPVAPVYQPVYQPVYAPFASQPQLALPRTAKRAKPNRLWIALVAAVTLLGIGAAILNGAMSVSLTASLSSLATVNCTNSTQPSPSEQSLTLDNTHGHVAVDWQVDALDGTPGGATITPSSGSIPAGKTATITVALGAQFCSDHSIIQSYAVDLSYTEQTIFKTSNRLVFSGSVN
jgi:hypothetical protein